MKKSLIPKEKYLNLKMEDKINLLRFERGHLALACNNDYQDISNAPKIPYDPCDVFVSSALGFDFRAFYSKEPVGAVNCKKEIKVNNVSIRFSFIGDVINTLVYDYVSYPKTGMPRNIDSEMVIELSTKIKHLYSAYKTAKSGEVSVDNLKLKEAERILKLIKEHTAPASNINQLVSNYFRGV